VGTSSMMPIRRFLPFYPQKHCKDSIFYLLDITQNKNNIKLLLVNSNLNNRSGEAWFIKPESSKVCLPHVKMLTYWWKIARIVLRLIKYHPGILSCDHCKTLVKRLDEQNRADAQALAIKETSIFFGYSDGVCQVCENVSENLIYIFWENNN